MSKATMTWTHINNIIKTTQTAHTNTRSPAGMQSHTLVFPGFQSTAWTFHYIDQMIECPVVSYSFYVVLKVQTQARTGGAQVISKDLFRLLSSIGHLTIYTLWLICFIILRNEVQAFSNSMLLSFTFCSSSQCATSTQRKDHLFAEHVNNWQNAWVLVAFLVSGER